ncbi:hypothetical protein C8A00DRAFT_16667 [Chaetomidium leptoderma]|uniref:Pathway-specific nitrogen regulator n=1 Tax=Chaetomidium leptoderma TaxID=669021 RepID=A0AAN6VIM5_9PEZI|nr:hypothetical protein C8A00DRAFT_16667 [Chaetomidium leptoderma]
MPRKTPDLDRDFHIYVDPSCLSEPMDDETPATQMSAAPEEVQEPVAIPDSAGALIAEEATKDAEDMAAQDPPTPEPEVTPAVEPATEEQPEAEVEAEVEAEAEAEATEPEPVDIDTATDEPSAPEVEEVAEVVEVAAHAEDTITAADGSMADTSQETEVVEEAEVALEPDAVEELAPKPDQTDETCPQPEAESVPEPEGVEEPVSNDTIAEPEEPEQPATQDEAATPEVEHDNAASPEDCEVPEPVEADDVAPEELDTSAEVPLEEDAHDEIRELPIEDLDTPDQQDMDLDGEEERGRERSTVVDRKTSLRTEALIQAAARAVVARIEKRKSGVSADEEGDEEHDTSLLSTGSQDTYVLGDDAQSTYSEHHIPSRPQSSQSQARHIPSRSISSDEAGDSSSHNERDDDVFSDRSARSSLCSLDAHDFDIKTPQAKDSMSRRDSYAFSSTQAARVVSNFSTISGLSQYDKEQFIPTSRENRMPFRTPSEIRAMQMASPTPSVFSGSSPRSSKRHGGSGGSSSGMGPISRFGSPTVSAQYSPKGRSTPTRFKTPRKEAPLVLLHVTLLPLRWVWGGVLNALDAVNGKQQQFPVADNDDDVPPPPFEASEPLKTLHNAWRELQDRVGDTVLERGILLPHPQNDYEVLEERLLEALELPLRRRARILECGHYLGPANEDDDEEESEEEYTSQSGRTSETKRHWCSACRDEIRYEHFGAGKVFRVKVYASNGLMRAGAWEACWKEMERVDIEVEPVVDSALQSELERLGALQLEQEEQRQQEEQRRLEMELAPEPEPKREPTPDLLRADTPSLQQQQQAAPEADSQRAFTSSPAPGAMQLTSTSLVRASTPSEPIDTSDERRRRDEERLREIYGDMPAEPVVVAAAAVPQLPAPPPPQPEPHPHHQHHHHQQQQQFYPPPPPQPQMQPQQQMQMQMPLLTDGSSYPPHTTSNKPRPIVLDENSGFVELLMEAFKVLLRDPKNVAIIVLCVFLVVMMKGAGIGGQPQQQQHQVQVQGPAAAVMRGYEEVSVVGGAVPRVGVESSKVVVAVPQQQQEEVVEGYGVVEEAGSLSLPVGEGMAAANVVVAAASPPPQSLAVEESLPVVEEPVVMESLESESTPAVEEVLDEPETTVEEVVVGPSPLPDDVCAPRGLEYPITMVGEVLPPSAAEECSAPTPPTEDEPQHDQDGAGRCEMDTDTDTETDTEEAASAPESSSSTSVFIPGPFVTERKTVRVFETVTETVRVSVVTQTETVSTVVTAVPQTVEETVYETETVRITVSVPVEERKKSAAAAAKAKATKGCKGGWF